MVMRGHGGKEIQDESLTGNDIKDGSILPNDVDFSTQSAIKSYLTTNQPILADTITKLNVDGVMWDNQLEYDSVNSQFTIKKGGIYIVTGLVTLDSAFDSMRAKIMLYMNDGAYVETLGDVTHGWKFANENSFTVGGTTLVKLETGDVVSFRIKSTHDVNAVAGVGKTNFILAKLW